MVTFYRKLLRFDYIALTKHWRALPGELRYQGFTFSPSWFKFCISPSRVGSLSCNRASGIPPSSHRMVSTIERRDSRGRFIKGNMPWNKSTDNTSTQREIVFICRHCGKTKPIKEMRVLTRFFPPLPACKDCWKLLE